MRRQSESFGSLLLKLPWWVSVVFGICLFGGVRWGLPIWAGQDNIRQILAKGIIPWAPVALLVSGMFALGSFLFAIKRGRLIDQQTTLETLRETSWKDFEYLVAEAYGRQGYQVEYSLSRGADGGVDLTLHKDGRKSLVQCKQWKVFSVGAPVIREMFGVMTAERADEAIVVTTGEFTRDARKFADGKPIHLIDGPQLLVLVQSVQTRKAESEAEITPAPTELGIPTCPQCGKPMVQRVARRGSNAGNSFWSCSRYPACKGTKS
jgi:restriction system protein